MSVGYAIVIASLRRAKSEGSGGRFAPSFHETCFRDIREVRGSMTATVSPQFRVVVRAPTARASRLQISDEAARPPGVVIGEADGATWVDAVHSLYARWANPGGTWLDANGTKQGT